VAVTIEHSRNLARGANAARGILVELPLAGRCYYYFRHFSSSRFFLRSGTGKTAISFQPSVIGYSCYCKPNRSAPFVKCSF
jgi:hypothetical protein